MSAEYSWMSNLNVEQRQLDEQRKSLLLLCKRAKSCADGKLDDEQFHVVLNDFLHAAIKLSNFEENYFKNRKYSDLEVLKSAHVEFIGNITEFIQEAMYGRLRKVEFADYVCSWCRDHVLVTDMKY